MRRVALIAVPFAIAGLAATFLLTRGSGEPPPLAITYRDIAEIDAYPVPEGPPPRRSFAIRSHQTMQVCSRAYVLTYRRPSQLPFSVTTPETSGAACSRG
jgi:hypothetical protein